MNDHQKALYFHGVAVVMAFFAAFAQEARAGSHTAQSSAFRVDTRDVGTMRVTAVSSRYCDGSYGGRGRHVYFLSGVDLLVAFEAQVSTGGKAVSRLEFNGVSQAWPNTSRALNVGALGAGGKLEVVAVATDGTRSQPFRANFDVAPFPPIVHQLFYPQTLALNDELTYTAPSFDIEVFKGKKGEVGGIPLPGKTMGIEPTFSAEASFSGDGTLTIGAAAGVDKKPKLNGTQGRRPDGKFGEAAGVEFGFDVEGEVVAVWNQPAGAWVVNSGYLGLNVYGSYSTAPYYVYAPPPIYLRADVSAELALGVRVSDLGTGQGWTPAFVASSEAFPEVQGVLGCGVGGVLALEGYVGLAGKFEFQSPPTVCTKLGIGGEIGAQVVVIGFATAPIEIWSGTYWIVGGQNPSGMMMPLSLSPAAVPLNLADLDTRPFRPVSRNYLTRRNVMALAASVSSPRIMALTGGSESALMTDGYPYPEPAVVAAGSTNHVLYLRDNEGRSVENRTELVEVHNAGGGWSAPVPVWDDGTGDFGPKTAALADGTMLAVWANGRAALTNNASLDEALKGLEIAVGERHPATGAWTCHNLTANAWLDNNPVLSAAPDGNAMVAWIRNRDLNPTGSPAEPNRILFAQRSGGVWSDEDYVAVNLGTLTYLDLAYNGTQAVIVFALDGDGDLSTRDDQELYGCSFDGTQWGAYLRLTSNAVQDTRPYVRYDAEGHVLVVWYQGGKIMSATGLGLSDPVEVGEVGVGSSAQDFKLVTGPNGQMAVVWQDAGAAGEASPDPYILNYDPIQRLWGRGVRLMEDPALERGFDGVFGADGRLRLAYSKVAVGESNGVPVFGAVDLFVLDHPVGPDPAIAAYGLALSTNALTAGESVAVSVTVDNLGDLAASNLAVCVFEGDPAAGGVLLGGTQRVERLPGGTSAVVTVSWTVPETASNVVLYAVVDPALETDDRNRANNMATLAALMPDLAVAGAQVMNESTNVRLIKVTVMNEGAVPAPAGVAVTFRRGASDGALLAEDTLGALTFGTNGVYDAGFSWDMSGASFTTAFEVVYIAVDPTNGVGELDERNNTTAVQVMTRLDTDGDGLVDGEEQRLGTRVDLSDTDGDGLSDTDEVRTYGTNPLLKDSDGDGSDDGHEIAAGTDPYSATDIFKIVTADGLESVVMSVTWNAKSGGVYRVEAAPTVTGLWGQAPDSAGENGSSLQAAVSNGVLRYWDSDRGVTNRFYRVKRVSP